MLRDVIENWEQHKDDLRKAIAQTDLGDIEYKKLMELIAVHIIGIEPKNLELQEIMPDAYQGCNGYMFCDKNGSTLSSDFYTAIAWYGSCSCCDAILGITDCETGLPAEKQVDELMKLCLELVQSIKRPYDTDAKEMED